MSLRARGHLLPPSEFGLILLLGILWGSPYALTKISLETIPPVTLVAARGFAGVIAVAGAGAFAGLGQHAIGQAAIILATISSAFGVIQGRRFESVAPELVAAAVLTSAAAVLVPLSLIVETPWKVSPS